MLNKLKYLNLILQ